MVLIMTILSKNLVIFFIASLSLMTISTYTVFYNCTVLRHNKTGQVVFMLKDFHLDDAEMKNTYAERKDLINVMKSLKDRGQSVHCLVEDSMKYRTDSSPERQSCLAGCFDGKGAEGVDKIEQLMRSTKFCKYFPHLEEMVATSPMFFLEASLRAQDISCRNVDCREIMNNLQNSLDRFSEKNSAKFDYEKERKGINALCRIAISQTANSIKNNFIKEKLLNFLYTYPVSDKQGIDKNFEYLVDIPAIHDIYENAHVQNVFVCTGGKHSQRIIKFLLSSGDYERITSFGKSNRVNTFLMTARVLGSIIAKTTSIPLYPLNIQQVFTQAQIDVEKVRSRRIQLTHGKSKL